MSGSQFDAPADADAVPLLVRLEAVLFVAERPVTIGELARLFGSSLHVVEAAVSQLEREYEGRGFVLQRQGDALQLVSQPLAAPTVRRFLGLEMSTRLSPAALETLAIVAYRQPITRAQIEQLRGVNPDHALSSLLQRGLIEEVGRLDSVGRPIVYGTTFEFLRAYGLRSLDDLPPAGESEQHSTGDTG